MSVMSRGPPKISSSEIVMLPRALDSMARVSRGPRRVSLCCCSSYWRWVGTGKGRRGSRHGWFPCVIGDTGAGTGTVPSLRCHTQLGKGGSKPRSPAPMVLFLPGPPVTRATVRVGMAMPLCKQWKKGSPGKRVHSTISSAPITVPIDMSTDNLRVS